MSCVGFIKGIVCSKKMIVVCDKCNALLGVLRSCVLGENTEEIESKVGSDGVTPSISRKTVTWSQDFSDCCKVEFICDSQQ